MAVELKGQICIEDPQEVAFREAAKEWVDGKIDYEQLMEKYPSYLLPPHERVARLVKQATNLLAKKFGDSLY